MINQQDEDIDAVRVAAREVFGELRPLWKSPQLAKRLRVVDVAEGFRSFIGR